MVVALPSRSVPSLLPVIVSPLSLPLYFVVRFTPLNSRVTAKATVPSLKDASSIGVTVLFAARHVAGQLVPFELERERYVSGLITPFDLPFPRSTRVISTQSRSRQTESHQTQHDTKNRFHTTTLHKMFRCRPKSPTQRSHASPIVCSSIKRVPPIRTLCSLYDYAFQLPL